MRCIVCGKKTYIHIYCSKCWNKVGFPKLKKAWEEDDKIMRKKEGGAKNESLG